MKAGTKDFNSKWKELASTDGNFGKSQKDFIKETHYKPQLQKLADGGTDLSGRGRAVQEAIFSTSVQFGGNTSLIKKALKGKDVASMSDSAIISSIQDYKTENNESLFRSSKPNIRAGTLKRSKKEKDLLLRLAQADKEKKNEHFPKPDRAIGSLVAMEKAADSFFDESTTKQGAPVVVGMLGVVITGWLLVLKKLGQQFKDLTEGQSEEIEERVVPPKVPAAEKQPV